MELIREYLAIPFGWILSFLFDITNNYLLSLIFITLVVRLLMLPQAIKQQKGSAKQMRLQAKVNKIRAKYATLDKREAQMKISEETQELYRREGFSMNNMGCLPMIIQLVAMMGLYGAMSSPLTHVLRLDDVVTTELKTKFTEYVASMGENAPKINTYYIQINALNKIDEFKATLDPEKISQDVLNKIMAFKESFRIGPIDLTDIPNEVGIALVVIPVLAGLTALLTSIFMLLKQKKTNPEMAKNPMMGCMTLMSPAMSAFFSWSMPAGIGFYWIISNILSFIQTVGLHFALKPDAIIAGQMIDETVTRRSREENIKIKAAMMKKQEEKNE